MTLPPRIGVLLLVVFVIGLGVAKVARVIEPDCSPVTEEVAP